MFITKEQDKLYQNYTDSFQFIRDFIKLVETQEKCVFKLFPEHLPYYELIQDDLLSDSLKAAEREEFQRLKDLLDSIFFLKDDFESFYLLCVKTVFKAINIMLHQIEWKVLRGNYENVEFLYQFTLFNIDLSPILASRAFKHSSYERMVEELRIAEDDMHKINKKLRDSHLCRCLEALTTTFPSVDRAFSVQKGLEIEEEYSSFTDKMNKLSPHSILKDDFNMQIDEEFFAPSENTKEEVKTKLVDFNLQKQSLSLETEPFPHLPNKPSKLLHYSHITFSRETVQKSLAFIKTNLSPSLIGTKRILKYDFMLIVKAFVEEFIHIQTNRAAPDAFINIMNMSAEISKFEGTENIVATMKEYARYLLIENSTKVLNE